VPWGPSLVEAPKFRWCKNKKGFVQFVGIVATKYWKVVGCTSEKTLSKVNVSRFAVKISQSEGFCRKINIWDWGSLGTKPPALCDFYDFSIK